MAQIYGELIRAQLQVSNGDLSSPVIGLVYFNNDPAVAANRGLKVHDGSAWQKLVTESYLAANSSLLPIVPLEKGGLGIDATTITGLVRISSPGGVSAGQITVDDIPDLTVLYSKLDLADGDIPQAKVADLVTDLGSKVDANTAITGATKTKITYDAKGLVTAGADLESADLPSELLNKTVSSTDSMTGALTLPAGGDLDRPPAVQGMIRYNTDLSTFEGHNGTDWGSIGGGGSAGGTVVTVPQVAHGLSVGNAVYLNGSTYAKAIATSAAAAEVVGVVSKADLPDEFDLTLSGELTGLTGLTTGEVYFLSPTTAGLLTVTEPSTIGQVSVPVGIASSTTSIYVAPKRGIVVGGVNARTEVALTSGAVTNVQSVAGMTAGELEGWVFISSASPVRFYVSAKFSLSGSGGDYNLNYQTTGDNPPSGFLIDITTAGMIRVTLPAASGSTSVINYALNAPAIGASFPLTVDAGTILSGTLDDARISSNFYKKTNILGTVSQSSGVPTGAIIETGSNANGTFIKYADGTMICRGNQTITSAISIGNGSIFYGSTSVTYAATFSSAPSVTISAARSAQTIWASTVSPGTSSCSIYLFSGVSLGSGSNEVTHIAIGRWF